MKPLLRQRLLAAVGLRRRTPAAAASPAAPPRSAPADEAAAPPLAGPPHGAAPAEALLRRLEWTVLRRLDGLLQGDCRTLMRGAGLDLADLREYQPHDDVRHIDWNVTARLAQPHVRQFQEDRDMTVVFLLDLSASVDWGSVLADPADGAVRTKQQVATELVALLARLFTRAGHKVGALIYRGPGAGGGGGTQELPARGGRGQVLQLLTRMAAAGPGAAPPARPQGPAGGWWSRRREARAAAAATADESTRLADLLRAAEHRLRRRCTVLLVSDFLSQPGWREPLGRLALRHDVLAVRLSDPSERALPAIGLVLLRDAESGEELLVDTDDPQLRARHAELAAAHEAQLRADLARAGVDTLELATAEPLLDTLRRFLDLRRLRQRQAAAPRRAPQAPASPTPVPSSR